MSQHDFPKPPFKHKRLVPRRVVLALGLLVLVVGTLVFPFPMTGRMWGDLFDLAHAPVFCLALICLIGFLAPPAIGLPDRFATIVPMNVVRVGLITVVLMIAGLVGEYLQKFAGRNPSWGDVAANSAGLLAGLAWVASRQLRGKARWFLSVTPFLIIAWVSANPILEVLDSVARMNDFPRIASFERPRELGNWGPHGSVIKRTNEWSTDGEYSLSVQLKEGAYPGVAMLWLESTWADYSSFEFDIRNPGDQSLPIIVKLQDKQHSQTGFDYEDRFHQQVSLSGGETKHVIIDLAAVRSAPAKREMNMDQINMIDIFSVDVKGPTIFMIDHLQLKR